MGHPGSPSILLRAPSYNQQYCLCYWIRVFSRELLFRVLHPSPVWTGHCLRVLLKYPFRCLFSTPLSCNFISGNLWLILSEFTFLFCRYLFSHSFPRQCDWNWIFWVFACLENISALTLGWSINWVQKHRLKIILRHNFKISVHLIWRSRMSFLFLCV